MSHEAVMLPASIGEKVILESLRACFIEIAPSNRPLPGRATGRMFLCSENKAAVDILIKDSATLPAPQNAFTPVLILTGRGNPLTDMIHQSVDKNLRFKISQTLYALKEGTNVVQTQERILHYEKLADIYENVADRVALQIKSIATARLSEYDPALYRQELQETLSLIVLNFPEGIRPVKPEDLKRWGISSEMIYDQALRNTRTFYKYPIKEEVSPTTGESLKYLHGDLAASQALVLQDYPELIGNYGSLVGIPAEEILLIYPVNGRKVEQVFPNFISVSQKLFQDGPRSINPLMYWYFKGRYQAFSYETRDDETHITSPKEFRELLFDN